MANGFESVIVVGAGPAGLLLAVMLAQREIRVKVVESQDQLDQRPRESYGELV
ncbi:fad binding domain-containing protein [Lasallia pustulata]|uniref:Fad binding domain-containing protein n=1 Tax=Lasallia pustulata TaxID=136370 RepID=A0A1W5D4N0_9LECA|nr:fad binding domain-containing protein [Lasallia pustulata]